MSPEDELIVSWPEIDIDVTGYRLFDELLSGLAYLGRAESWVEARRIDQWHGEYDCMPGDNALDVTTGEVGEVVPLFCPQTLAAYVGLREHWQQGNVAKEGKVKAKGKKGGPILPESWLDAVSLETSELQATGWSQPPAAKRVFYRRPSNCLQPAATTVVSRTTKDQLPITTVRFALYGKPLPRMEDAVKIGELARIALMHLTEKHLGQIPAILSGHDLPEANRHEHAFFLPEPNGQGRIDHLLIHAPGGIEPKHLRAIQKLNRLFTRDGSEWQVMYEGSGDIEVFSDVSHYAGNSHVWRSVTPYLRPWYIKKNFGLVEQIRRECRLRSMPEPTEIKVLPEVILGSIPLRSVHFHRFRGKRGLTQPDTIGSLVEIVFSEPLAGPLALGFGCHYGLGLFAAQ